MPKPVEILKKYWGYSFFRELQEEIVQSVLTHDHTLALLPTGGGKSICFQIPALMLDGICIVVCPLIALMRDQVSQLERRGIKATAVYAGMTPRELDITLDNCVYGKIKLLYVSPERLQSSLFLARAEKMNISMITVDEAHCISQWGYDFRPLYLEIKSFIKSLQIEKVIALTATATREVKQDIIDKLGMSSPAVFTGSFARENLSYSVFRLERKETKLLEILRNVPGSGIVYARSRKRTKEISDFLRASQINSDYYHAGLSPNQRNKKHTNWINNRIRVMVATNAFGMGIDKPDVRSVIHVDLPNTLEAYYQEAGRAGRDGKRAYAAVLYQPDDPDRLKQTIIRSHVSIKDIKRVYQALANHFKLAVGSLNSNSTSFSLDSFSDTYQIPLLSVFNAISKLEEEGLLQVGDSYHQSSQVMFLLPKEELYAFQIAHTGLDPIIKILLRLHGGEVFNRYIGIREKDLADVLCVSREEVIDRLKLLVQYDVIDYLPHESGTQITFLTPRLDINQLPIDARKLENRKTHSLHKAGKVIDYITNVWQCRTRILQAYFDEPTDWECGICDCCIGKKKVSGYINHDEIFGFLKKQKNVSYQDLKSTFHALGSESINAAIRQLVEEGKIEVVNQRISLI